MGPADQLGGPLRMPVRDTPKRVASVAQSLEHLRDCLGESGAVAFTIRRLIGHSSVVVRRATFIHHKGI